MPSLFVWVPCLRVCVFSCALQLLEPCCMYRCHRAATVAVAVVVAVDLSLFFASKHTFLVHCCRHFSVYFCLYYYLIYVVCVWVFGSVRYTREHIQTDTTIQPIFTHFTSRTFDLTSFICVFVYLEVCVCVCAVECVRVDLYWMKMHTIEWYLWLAQVFTLMSVTYLFVYDISKVEENERKKEHNTLAPRIEWTPCSLVECEK